jgi:hypothetical protein
MSETATATPPITSTPPPAAPSADNAGQTTAPNVPGPKGIRGVFGSILTGVGNIILPGLGTAIGAAVGGTGLGAAMPGLGSETTQYLMLQRQIQLETQAYETASAVQKARHDAAMHAIQNMK